MYAAVGFTEANIKTMTLYRRHQLLLLLQMSTSISRGHRCIRRCDIAMVIVIFAGQSVLAEVIEPLQYRPPTSHRRMHCLRRQSYGN